MRGQITGVHPTSSNCGSHICVKLNLTNQALLTTSAEAIASMSHAFFANLSLAVSIHRSRSGCQPDDFFSNQYNVAKFSHERVLKDRSYRWVIVF
jgi:hypothetical protein